MAGEKFDSKSFNPQAFGAYTERIPNLKRNELIKSRALKGNQDIKNTFSSQTGTVYAVLPMHGLIGGVAQNYDGETDLKSENTDTFERCCCSWSYERVDRTRLFRRCYRWRKLYGQCCSTG